MNPGEKFTDETVRWIKEQLIQGVQATMLARHLRVNVNTIRRIKLGQSYAGVYVPGEESLRPALGVGGAWDQGKVVEAVDREIKLGKEPTEAEVEASQARLARLLAEPEGGVKSFDQIWKEAQAAAGEKTAG